MTTQTATKITGLTLDQSNAAKEYIAAANQSVDVKVNRTTMTVSGVDVATVLTLVDEALAQPMAGRGYPRQPLMSLRRKVEKALGQQMVQAQAAADAEPAAVEADAADAEQIAELNRALDAAAAENAAQLAEIEASLAAAETEPAEAEAEAEVEAQPVTEQPAEVAEVEQSAGPVDDELAKLRAKIAAKRAADEPATVVTATMLNDSRGIVEGLPEDAAVIWSKGNYFATSAVTGTEAKGYTKEKAIKALAQLLGVRGRIVVAIDLV